LEFPENCKAKGREIFRDLLVIEDVHCRIAGILPAGLLQTIHKRLTSFKVESIVAFLNARACSRQRCRRSG
jgi:hypothetical protein